MYGNLSFGNKLLYRTSAGNQIVLLTRYAGRYASVNDDYRCVMITLGSSGARTSRVTLKSSYLIPVDSFVFHGSMFTREAYLAFPKYQHRLVLRVDRMHGAEKCIVLDSDFIANVGDEVGIRELDLEQAPEEFSFNYTPKHYK